jgi:hypothetical protein
MMMRKKLQLRWWPANILQIMKIGCVLKQDEKKSVNGGYSIPFLNSNNKKVVANFMFFFDCINLEDMYRDQFKPFQEHFKTFDKSKCGVSQFINDTKDIFGVAIGVKRCGKKRVSKPIISSSLKVMREKIRKKCVKKKVVFLKRKSNKMVGSFKKIKYFFFT